MKLPTPKLPTFLYLADVSTLQVHAVLFSASPIARKYFPQVAVIVEAFVSHFLCYFSVFCSKKNRGSRRQALGFHIIHLLHLHLTLHRLSFEEISDRCRSRRSQDGEALEIEKRDRDWVAEVLT